MTTVSTQDGSLELTEQAIADFLKDHPDFFQRHDHLLTSLKISHQERGAISLVEMQLNRLRERVSELEEDITQLMSVAASNENLYRAIARAHSKLFSAKKEIDIQKALAELALNLKLSVSLRFYDETLIKEDVKKIKASHFSGQSIYLGRLRKQDAEVFISQPPELGSYMLIPVTHAEKNFGFLSFASQEGGHFQPHMDTLFVEQLAQHIGILLAELRDNQ